MYRSFSVGDESGPANCRLDRGETAAISLVLRNAGSASPEVSGRLVSPDSRLVVLGADAVFGPAEEAETTVSRVGFTVLATRDAPIEEAVRCTLYVAGAGYSDTLVVPIVVGDSMNLPTGPDAYGYSILDHTDSCYEARAAFDWVELRESGTRLELGDDETQVIALPEGFGTWRYYGEEYDSIAICSNGWVAAGASGRVDFVNVQLPYPSAPPNIVAVCWDNLAPDVYGAVWYHWDSACGRFVVEYDSVPYFGHTLHWEKVQFHLYDRTVSTRTGDNAIEVHFRTVNDFASVTVGLQNRDGSAGLTQFWNGWYPRTAARLGPSRALRIETGVETGVAESATRSPVPTRLVSVPSVFRPGMTARFVSARAQECRAEVYSATGQLVRSCTGRHGRFEWDGRNSRGEYVPSGVYVARTASSSGRVLFFGR